VLGTSLWFVVPLFPCRAVPVFFLWRLLCLLLLFLVCFFRLGFFLLLVVVAVLSVLFGSVGSCLFGVALLLRLRFRCLMPGPCVASSGVDLWGVLLWWGVLVFPWAAFAVAWLSSAPLRGLPLASLLPCFGWSVVGLGVLARLLACFGGFYACFFLLSRFFFRSCCWLRAFGIFGFAWWLPFFGCRLASGSWGGGVVLGLS